MNTLVITSGGNPLNYMARCLLAIASEEDIDNTKSVRTSKQLPPGTYCIHVDPADDEHAIA